MSGSRPWLSSPTGHDDILSDCEGGFSNCRVELRCSLLSMGLELLCKRILSPCLLLLKPARGRPKGLALLVTQETRARRHRVHASVLWLSLGHRTLCSRHRSHAERLARWTLMLGDMGDKIMGEVRHEASRSSISQKTCMKQCVLISGALYWLAG
jgi:hypothetical protein